MSPSVREPPRRSRAARALGVLVAAIALTGLCASQAVAAPGGLVAAYSFDEGSGLTVGDESGNGNIGTISGAAWTTGRYGSALSFDGVGARVDLPQLGTFYKSGFTLEAWVNKSGAKKDVAIVGSWDPAQNGGPMLWVDHISGRYYETLGAGLENYLDSGQAPAPGQWQHVSATYDGATATFYIDGTPVAARSFPGNAGDANAWRIGAYGVFPSGFFDGAIDDVRIYDHALTAAEIQGDMATPITFDTVAPSDPTGFAKTGDSSSTIATTWTASTDDRRVAGYRLYVDGTEAGTTTSTSYTFTGLACSTAYELGVEAFDGAGNVSGRTLLSAAGGPCDTTPPTVSVTAPAAGDTVTGMVTATATASDDESVRGVQFRLDGSNLGSEDTTSPYAVDWDTSAVGPGSHTLTAVARDPSGNSATSAPVAVTVAATPSSAPVAAYSFDDGAGTVAADATGHGYTGTVVGATWTTGRYGSGLSFDGTASRVDLPSLPRFYKLGFTLEAWVRKAGAKKDVAVVGSWDATQNGGPMAWVDFVSGRYQLTLNAGSSNYLDSGRAPATGTWQHVAATYDGATARFFVDGTPVASRSFAGNVGDSDDWRIGAYGGSPGGFFDGLIDEVRIYDRARTTSQIQADMAARVAPAPAVVGTTPADGATGTTAAPAIRASFNEAMSAATVNSTTVQLRNASGTQVPATVSYNAATATASVAATSALAYGAKYTVTVKGGSAGVLSASGAPMAADRSWSFTVVPQPSILVVTSAARPFSRYTAEILEAEGLAESTTLDVSLMTPSVLNGFDEVVLGDAALTNGQVNNLTNWVSSGGNLIALRPDRKLASLLGLSSLGTTLSNAYLKVNTAAGTPGAGIVGQTIQFHGTADRYSLAGGTTAVATLYSTGTTATTSPAVTLRSVGTQGGQAAAFTFDLARSVVYTRQGNPAWAGQERDGLLPIRPDDLFFGGGQADWVDLTKVAIPQADEQQRLLANLVTLMGADRRPVPRFWYLPQGYKAAVVMTGDDHAEGGTAGRFDQYLAAGPAGCSVAAWTCVRSTSYLYPAAPLTDAQARDYVAQGFEIALHTSPIGINQLGCANWTAATLPGIYDTQLTAFHRAYPSIAGPVTHRMHCVTWSDWASQPKVELANGIRLDTNYYYFPGSWIATKPGFMTGSGLPMRFADADGTVIDVFQATTEITDESGQAEPSTVNALLDNAVGSNGYYGAFVANIHTDRAVSADSDAIVASAQARGVPIVSAKQLLDWTDGREASTLDTLTWSNGTLTFKIGRGGGAAGLQGMLPLASGSRTLRAVTLNGGTDVPFTTRTVKGIAYAFFDAVTGSYSARYA